jgi:hypothetical protein
MMNKLCNFFHNFLATFAIKKIAVFDSYYINMRS